jgi:hypothetical protein
MRKLLLLSNLVLVVLLREMSIPFLPFECYIARERKPLSFAGGM